MGAEFESNWSTAMGGHLDYQGVANRSAGAGAGGGEGGGTEPAYTPPKNYKPSSPQQRTNWNQFLDYLESKGVGGSKDLDARDRSLGAQYLREYNKANPDKAVPEDFVPTAQYESYLIRKKAQFPGLSDKQAQYAFGRLAQGYRDRPISAVDSWLGSATSKQYYPTYERVSNTAPKQSFGTSFEDYVKGVEIQ